MHRSDESMNSIGDFQKIVLFPQFPQQSRKTSLSLIYICVGQFCHVLWRFLHGLQGFDGDEVTKRGDEALNANRFNFQVALNASSLHCYNFFLSVKCFIAKTLYEKTSFNALSPLLLKINSSLNASSPLLFKVTLPTSGIQHTFSYQASVIFNDRQCSVCTLYFKIWRMKLSVFSMCGD